MATADLGQPAHAFALERLAGDLDPQTLGQTGTRFLQAHDTFGSQAQTAREIIVAHLALHHYQRIGLQQGLALLNASANNEASMRPERSSR